jgi:hypothetical protein
MVRRSPPSERADAVIGAIRGVEQRVEPEQRPDGGLLDKLIFGVGVGMGDSVHC